MARKPKANPKSKAKSKTTKKAAAGRRKGEKTAKKTAKKTARKPARRPAKKTTRKPAKKTPPETPRQRVISAALRLAVVEGWGRVSLARIAAEAGLDLAGLRAEFSSKAAIVGGFMADVDKTVLAAGVVGEGIDESESARDRLFEVLMRRFDVLNPQKQAVAALIRGTCANPGAMLCTVPRVMGSMTWMLEAAGLSSAGWSGYARRKGLALVYVNALRAWLGDDTADMTITMAALDRGLRVAERAAKACAPGRWRGVPAADE